MDYQWLLDKWNLRIGFDTLLGMWNESHRGYHSQKHLEYLIDKIESLELSELEKEKMLLTAIFHDIVYDPNSGDNELRSAEFLLSVCSDYNDDIEHIYNMIISTKEHNSDDYLSSLFNELDMSVVMGSYEELLEWESGIYHEFKHYGNESYKLGRISFLNSLIDKYPTNYINIQKLIDYIENNYK
jgi:pantetheine-phosphate adenylyltransferase